MACSIADVWNNFQRIECDWWVSMIRKSPEIVNELQDNGLKPEAMMINGEILFCLLGLKPIVIASEIPEQWRSDFMEGVITRSGIDGIASVGLQLRDECQLNQFQATFHMEVRRLDNIRSPCLDLSGSWVFMNVIHPLYSQATSVLFSSESDPIPDGTLALLLDYPVPLDSISISDAIEVAYVQSESSSILTSYIADHHRLHLVNDHFQHYRGKVHVNLELRARRL